MLSSNVDIIVIKHDNGLIALDTTIFILRELRGQIGPNFTKGRNLSLLLSSTYSPKCDH